MLSLAVFLVFFGAQFVLGIPVDDRPLIATVRPDHSSNENSERWLFQYGSDINLTRRIGPQDTTGSSYVAPTTTYSDSNFVTELRNRQLEMKLMLRVGGATTLNVYIVG